jgi:glutamate-1-semialdehyde 2,1-aminomutase
MGNGSVLLGHNHPAVTEAVARAVHSGVGTGYETPAAVEAVELLAEILPDCGAVRFANTGTEAVMHALAIARHATGRTRIAKAEASYHGWSDPVWVSNWPTAQQYGPARRPATVPGSAGLGPDAADTLVLPFNDSTAAEQLIDAHADSLAAVIVEPVLIDIGFIPATVEYLQTLRAATRRHGIVLIFDELLTGFRIALGGAREVYGVRADLTTFGKALANGYPVAAVEGSPELLAHTDPTRGGPVGWVGTYNGHAVAMAATCASLAAMRDGAPLAHLAALTSRLQNGAAQLATATGVPVVIGAGGGHFQPYFRAQAPRDYRSALASDPARYDAFTAACRRRGILVAEKPLLHCALSAAHGEADVDLVLACIEESLAARSHP